MSTAHPEPINLESTLPDSLELRVLSGAHQNAHSPVEQHARIGLDPDCDIVLSDLPPGFQPQHLELDDQGWSISTTASESDQPVWLATPYQQARQLGGIWITVCTPDSPWPELPLAEDTTADEPAQPADIQTGTTDTPSVSPTSSTMQPASPSWARRAGLTLITLLTLIVVLMIMLMPRAKSDPPDLPDPNLAREQSIGKITAIIEQLGLASRLHISIRSDDMVQVSGWVRDTQEHDRLASALSQVWPMPAMQVSNESQALQLARHALAGVDIVYEARYEGDGRMSVTGIARDADSRSTAVEAVRRQLPGMAVMSNDIFMAPDVARTLSDELLSAGLTPVTLNWAGRQLQVRSDALDAEQIMTVQGVLERFNQTHFGVATLQSSVPARANSVPFKIRSVVSGETPYLVLGDGTKLLLGGTYKHYRLSGIDEHQLTFDGPYPAIVLR